MAEEKLQYTLTLATRATGTGAKETAVDLDRVRAKTDAATTSMKPLADKVQAAGPAAGKMGMAMDSASYQIQDFAVQVGGGVSAITAFAQQAPQFIGGLQMAGVVAGSAALPLTIAAAAIPIVAFGGKAIFQWLTSAAEGSKVFAEEVAKNVKSAVDNIGQLDTERLDTADRKATKAIETAALLAEKFDAVEKAEGKASLAALDDAEANRKAQLLVAEALGLQVDKHQELAAIAEAAKAKAEMEAQQKIASLNAASQAAVNATWKDHAEVQKREVARQALAAEVAAEEAKLAVLIRQNEQRAREQVLRSQKHFDPVANQLSREYLAEKPAKDKELTASQNRVDALRQRLERALEDVDNNAAQIEKLNDKITDTVDGNAIEIQSIMETLDNSTMRADATALVGSSKQLVAGMEEALGKIVPNTEAAVAAKESALQILSDGRVAANEQATLHANIAEMVGGIQLGNSKVNGNVATIIAILTSFQVQQAATEAKLQRLLREQERLSGMATTVLPTR